MAQSGVHESKTASSRYLQYTQDDLETEAEPQKGYYHHQKFSISLTISHIYNFFFFVFIDDPLIFPVKHVNPVKRLLTNFLVLLTVRLNRLSHNYRYVNKILTAEKKGLKV